jgi:hypothetical protein
LASLWITGLALILSTLGFADYHAARAGRRIRQELEHPTNQVAIQFGLMLFCLGLAGSMSAWWEKVLWAVLAVAFAGYALVALRAMRRDKGE